MRFLDPVQPSAIPALLFLIFLPLWPFVQRRHARLFFTVLSIIAILLVARPLVGGGLIAVIALAYFPIEWAARLKSGRRVALFVGWLILHAALLACFHLPLPSPFTHLRPEDGPAVYVLLSGIGLTFLRLVSHLYDRLTGRTRPMSFADYLCYMVYFPKFRHGPLERGRRFVRQLTEARANWRSSDVVTGLARCALGLATVLAVPFAAWKLPDWFGTLGPLSARTLFLQPGEYSTLQIIVIIHAIPVVIYAFESGFASIQLGVSRALGVRGSENFRYPFLSSNPQAVWRRWNITIFAWLRDYAYAPLGGGRHHRTLNIILVFVYCGLLHGFQLRGVVWGLYTGCTVAAYVWLAGKWRERRRANAHTARSFPSKPRIGVSVLLRVGSTVATMEWLAIGAVILADPNHCGATLLRDYFGRIAGLLATLLTG